MNNSGENSAELSFYLDYSVHLRGSNSREAGLKIQFETRFIEFLRQLFIIPYSVFIIH